MDPALKLKNIDPRLRILLTPDGKGIEKKAHVLLEILEISIPQHRKELKEILDTN